MKIAMKKGKEICNYLKEVRQKVAAENNIPLEPRECTFQGECQGTCPRCEAEVRYLEAELAKKAKLGKAAAVVGVALAASLPFASCTEGEPVLEGDIAFPNDTLSPNPNDTLPADTLPFEGSQFE